MTTTCASPTSSDVVPGGTGAWSARLTANSWVCQEVDAFTLAQQLPWIASGTWTLSGWLKSATVGTSEPSRVMVRGVTVPQFFNDFGAIVGLDTTWTFASQTFTIPDGYPADSIYLSIFPVAVPDSAIHYCYYDAISLDFSTGVIADGVQTAPFRPNPAIDRVWVDLPEAPTTVTAIDATGRSILLQTFHHNGRTLEVDVSSVSAGLCVMVMNTPSGFRMVRFIKT